MGKTQRVLIDIEQQAGSLIQEIPAKGVRIETVMAGKTVMNTPLLASNFPGISRNGAKADQAKSTHHCNAGTNTAVNQHNDDLYHRRQRNQRQKKASGTGISICVGPCNQQTQQQGNDGACQKRAERKSRCAGGKNAGKYFIKHK